MFPEIVAMALLSVDHKAIRLQGNMHPQDRSQVSLHQEIKYTHLPKDPRLALWPVA